MIIGTYEGIPLGCRVIGRTATEVLLEVVPVLPPPDGGEPLPVAA